MTARPRRKRQAPEILMLRYLAWCKAKAADFDLTRRELAEALDVPPHELTRALRGEAWARKLQASRENLEARDYAAHYVKRIIT